MEGDGEEGGEEDAVVGFGIGFQPSSFELSVEERPRGAGYSLNDSPKVYVRCLSCYTSAPLGLLSHKGAQLAEVGS